MGAHRSLSGIEGLSMQRGIGQFLIGEVLLGASYRYEQAQGAFLFGGGAALHFQLRQLGDVGLLTAGLRYSTLFGDPCVLLSRCQGELIGDARAQFFELPLRIYWFPNRFISLHTEFGALLQLDQGEEGFSESVGSSGNQMDIFRGRSFFGGVGLSVWL